MEDDTDWLGLDLTGNQPKINDNIGHNSEADLICRISSTVDSLIKLGEEHEKSLQALVDKQDDEREEILLILGRQLLVGRKRFEDSHGNLKNLSGFGEWTSNNFPNLQQVVNRNEQAAIIWAAEFPQKRQEMLDKYPRVRTSRGAYAKWKEEQKKLEEAFDTSDDNDDVVDNEDTPVTSTGSSGSSSGNTQQGSSDASSANNSDSGKGGINTSNPDTSLAKTEATMIASSLIGVVTNMIMFERTQERPVNKRELASAIFNEIRNGSTSQLTEDEIEDYIENQLKRTLNIILESLPVLDGFESNVVNMNKTLEKFK